MKSPKYTNRGFHFRFLYLTVVLICLLRKNDLFTSTAILFYDRRIVFALWLTATQVGVITVRSTNNYIQKKLKSFFGKGTKNSLVFKPCLIHFVILFLCTNLLCNKPFIFCLVVSRSVMQNTHMNIINLVPTVSHCR